MGPHKHPLPARATLGPLRKACSAGSTEQSGPKVTGNVKVVGTIFVYSLLPEHNLLLVLEESLVPVAVERGVTSGTPGLDIGSGVAPGM
jgi:hypothetical protein